MNDTWFYSTSLFILIVLGFVGWYRVTHFSWNGPIGDVIISGTVSDRIDERFDGDRVIIRSVSVWDGTMWRAVSHKRDGVQIYLPELHGLTRGDRVVIRGAMNEIEPFVSDTGRMVPYHHMMALARVGAQMRTASVVYHVSHVVPLEFFDHIYIWSRTILRSYIPFPASSLSAGVLIGDQSGFSDEAITHVRAVGLSHIIVLSGFNVTLVATLLMRKKQARRIYPYVFGCAALVFFLLLVGPTQSLIRASVMTVCLMAVRFYGNTRDELRALVIAIVVVGIITPGALLWDVGFHLSACATAGLVVFGNRLEKALDRIPIGSIIRSTIAATSAAQLGTLPVQMWYFGIPHPISLIANIAVVPLVPCLMATSALVVMSSFIPIAPWIFGSMSWVISSWIWWVAILFSP